MLYGLDDDEYAKEFNKMRKKQIQVKNILLLFVIIIICVGCIYGLIKYISKDEKKEVAKEEKVQEQVQTTVHNSVVIEPKKNKEENDVYQGNHIQIPDHDINKLKTRFIPQANPDAAKIIKDIYYSDEKQVYLTFDDGPSRDITPQILETLKQYDVKATFFVLGARVDLYPELLRREYEEGHYIANHGYSHDYASIYESKDTTFQEYIDCENSIKNALGNSEFNTYLFRFPGGSSGGKYEKVKQEARELFRTYGVAFTNWNCLTGDAEGKNTKEASINEMIRTKDNQNSIILLMHDANDKQQTADALPEIIEYYKNEGYTFKTFYEVFK